MVAIVLIHMVQVFLFGAFKFPRELLGDRSISPSDDTGHGPLPDKFFVSIKTRTGTRPRSIHCQPCPASRAGHREN